MKSEYIGLLTTLLLGIFILIGTLIAFLAKKRQKIIDFSLALAFSVIIMLIVFDLLPEISELLSLKYIWLFLIGVVVGYVLLKILDNFIPDHNDNKMNNKELKENLAHIGIVSSIALVIHNIIEGMAVYQTVLSSSTTGLMLAIGVGFHNLPLGMVIATTFYQANQSKKKTLIATCAISLSTLFGGVIMFLLNNQTVNSVLLGTLLSITLGMLLYIAFSELYPRVKKVKYKTARNIGILLGIIIMIISILI